jgi:6-phosphogluconolactonase
MTIRGPEIRQFSTAADAAAALVDVVAAELERAIRSRGQASLAVPGGTTPGMFLTLLGSRNLDWPNVSLTLTDERWVAPSSERSNAGLVGRTFAVHAKGYRWFGLWREGIACDAAPPILDQASRDLPWPLDIVVLGMGADGHVASLFPGQEAGFVPAGNARYVAVKGPADEPRVSLRASALIEARQLYLLVNGPQKLVILSRLPGSGLPVARVLAARPAPTSVFAGP